MLLKELERMEDEKAKLERKNQEAAELAREQNRMLQEKLNQCYKDIQKLSSHRAHEDNLSKSTAFDSREPLSQRAVLIHQAVQTEATDKKLESSFANLDEKYLVPSNQLKQSIAGSMPSERHAPAECVDDLKKQLQEKEELVE